MTREMWVQYFVGAYAAFADCGLDEALEAAQGLEGVEIDTENDDPIESAKAAVDEDELEAAFPDAVGGSAG